ncbi:MAG TPA: efflux RND transporter periplasmic adaptor subunit [Terriglobales bacterium]|jgi:putative peptide zinc metalloprotease protein|nr:efflux RND transporter periplasmic adaptor subunit [Terriglobales bacterium]
MNILEALEVALPDLPATTAKRRYPKLDARVIYKEHIEQGERVVLAKMPGTEVYLRFSPEQWQLLQLFDGERSYKQISELIFQQANITFTEDDVREFASYLEDQGELFYKTPLEKNITLKQKMSSERHKRGRFHVADVTDITLHTWPNADDYLTAIKPYLEFIYTTWFTLLTLVMFGVMVWMWTDKFGEIWSDSFAFYNFTAKSTWDLVEFWFLFGAMAFFHETAHGLTCKHFGARVEKMQFLLMYFAPTFVCDATQVWVIGDKRARVTTIIAGIWGDLMICVAATFIWWGTATGMFIHDLAYKVMMVTGIGVTLLNLNPLIKLDGYYLFSELIGETDLKERSTAYVSSWTRKHLFRLPAEVEYVPRRQRVLYIVYSLLSSAYSYLLMAFVVIFVYHILRAYTPEWAWLPGLLFAFKIFKSRITLLERFMKTVYLDKKERLLAWFTPARAALLGIAVVVIALTPVWPDFVDGRFTLEPVRRTLVRTEVPGTVTEIFTDEGQQVTGGGPLLRLRNLDLESAAAQAGSDMRIASARATQASMNYQNFGAAEHERQQSTVRQRSATEEVKLLDVTSPISGTVTSPRLRDLLGSYLKPGTEVAEIADTSTMSARIYIPEFGMLDVRLGDPVRLHSESQFKPWAGTLQSLAPASSAIEIGLIDKAQLEGLRVPQFYIGKVELQNHGELREGMSGNAKILVGRRSLAGLAWRFARDLAGRRMW